MTKSTISRRGAAMREIWRIWWESDEEKDTTIGELWDKMAEAAEDPKRQAMRAKLRELVKGWKCRQMEDERTWKSLPPNRRDLWSGRAAATAECIDGLESLLEGEER